MSGAINYQCLIELVDGFCPVSQSATLLAMYAAAVLHAHPLERVWLLLSFFLGAAEIASGVTGL
jgi:hypothetical protein